MRRVTSVSEFFVLKSAVILRGEGESSRRSRQVDEALVIIGWEEESGKTMHRLPDNRESRIAYVALMSGIRS